MRRKIDEVDKWKPFTDSSGQEYDLSHHLTPIGSVIFYIEKRKKRDLHIYGFLIGSTALQKTILIKQKRKKRQLDVPRSKRKQTILFEEDTNSQKST